MLSLPDHVRALESLSRRQQVIELIRELKAEPGWLVTSVNPDDYVPLLEVHAKVAGLNLVFHHPYPIQQSSAWRSWWAARNLLTRLHQQAPWRNEWVTLIHLGGWDLANAGKVEVLKTLVALPWRTTFADYLKKLKELPSTATFANQLQSLPRQEAWDDDDATGRLALLDWLSQQQRALAGIEELQPYLAQANETLERLVAQLRQVRLERQATSPLALDRDANHFYPLAALPPLDKKSRLWILGATEEEFQNLETSKLGNLKNLGAVTVSFSTLDEKGERLTPLLKATVQQTNAVPATHLHSDEPLWRSSVTQKSLSMSQLAQFALCPYRYFAKVDLALPELEEIDPYSLSRRHFGELSHAFFERQLRPALEGRTLDDQAAEQVFEKLAAEFLPHGVHGAFQQLEWQELQTILRQALAHEVEWLRQLNAKPRYLEHAVEYKLGNWSIRCRMDRVDEIPLDDGRQALMVIDYKTSSGSVGPKNRQQMVDLITPQLPIYLLALQQTQKLPVLVGRELKLRSLNFGGLASEALAKRLKNKVYALLPEEKMVSSLTEKLALLLQRLESGDRRPAPQDPESCGLGNCPAWGLCRYDLVELDEEPGYEDQDEAL